MRDINHEEAILLALAGDQVYMMVSINDMTVKEIRDQIKAGAVFAVLEESPAAPEEASKKCPPRKSYDKGKLIALYNAGWSYKKIAEEMGITESAVNGVISRYRYNRKKEASKNGE